MSAEPPIDLWGRIDMHVHGGPDVLDRKASCAALVADALAAGMRGVLLKNHFTLTADVAAAIAESNSSIAVLGGLALNNHVGGLNPLAVEAAVKMGASEIWMPTLSSGSERSPLGPGLSILCQDGRLRTEVLEILDMIAQANVILGTGHLPRAEILQLVPVATKHRVQKIVVTHPDHYAVGLERRDLEHLSKFGVFFEYCYVFQLPGHSTRPIEDVVEDVRLVGPGRTVLATDLGQPENPTPVDGFRAFLSALARSGLKLQDLDVMTMDNPRALLGLT